MVISKKQTIKYKEKLVILQPIRIIVIKGNKTRVAFNPYNSAMSG